MNMLKMLNQDIEKIVEQQLKPLGIKSINYFKGGLGNGDFGLIFGNPGGGKSWSLVALGGHAVKLGYNVLHYTLELGEQYVGRRYDAYFSKIGVDKIQKHKDKIENL